jgi:molybdopterin-guanine dinucleotide biosynthesis protein A
MTSSPPPVFGLILAGGMSRRMQTDKAALEIHGKQQLERAFELASSVCAKTSSLTRYAAVSRQSRTSIPAWAPSPASRRRKPRIRKPRGWCSPATCRS